MEGNNDRNANPAAEDPVGNDDNDEENNHDDRAEEADDDDNEDEDRGDNNNDNNNDMDLEDDDEENDNDSTLDGGVAIGAEQDASKAKKHSSECDLLLYVYCQEPIDVAPDHPIMRPGVTVSIGLDKATKLEAVFQRYVDFCNTSADADTSSCPLIHTEDLEFSFCQLLSGDDTAESGALMKNDRIRVRKVRTTERELEAEQKREYRESDKEYFRQMRQLMPDSCPARIADVVLDCRGKLLDKHGRNQCVLSTTVRAHSSLISKRCPWLMAMIIQARLKAKREAEEGVSPSETPDHSPTRAAEIENDEEAETSCHAAIETNDSDGRGIGDTEEAISGSVQIDMVDDSSDDGKVNVIIMDEDEDDADDVVSSSRHQIQSQQEANMLTVVLSDHSPEAVKILLEYCYTNRVLSLGYHAFVQACKTKPSKQNGPVHPCGTKTKYWPDDGKPSVALSVALAGIRLAEEAGMHRLSLMCEISAAQLVSHRNVVEALTMSTEQKASSGNDLPILRRTAMKEILGRGKRSASGSERSSYFRKLLLDDDRANIVPTLIQGTMELVTYWEKSKGAKRSSFDISALDFKKIDEADSYKRARERKRRRREKLGKDSNKISDINEDYLSDLSAEEEYEEGFPTGRIIEWAHVAHVSKRALKRMVHHDIDSIRREALPSAIHSKKSTSRKRSGRSSSRSKGVFASRDK